MKQNLTKKIAFAITLLSLSAFSGQANAQCLTAGEGQWPSSTFTPTCNGLVANIATNCFAGEYSVVNVTSGVQYTFSSSIATDFLTIGNTGGTTALASGITPLVWTATTTGTIRFYTHTNAACGEQQSNRARRVLCGTPPPPPTSCATLLTPANGATDVTLNPAPNFSWTAVAGATGYEFYLGTAPGSMTLLGSTPATNVAITGNDPNTTYYWYVVPFNGGGSVSGCNTSMSSFTTGAVNNDNCAGAVAVNAIGGIQYVSVTGATESLTGCAGDATADVWYKVTTDNAGDLTITAEPDNTDLVLEVFTGTCGALTSLACVDEWSSLAETYDIVGAAANATYYFRIYDYDGIDVGTIGTASVAGTALPVTMDKLKGQVTDGNLAQLSWRTLTEQNNKGFEIQRSVDGNTFNTVGFVASKAANGTSKEEITYSFTDAAAINGTVYYRLQQTDIDGKTALSNTVRLTTKEKGAFEIVAVPNPVKNNLNIRTYGERANDANILITDLSGKVVRRINITASEANIDMSTVANGIYLLKYTDANRTQTLKVSKQ